MVIVDDFILVGMNYDVICRGFMVVVVLYCVSFCFLDFDGFIFRVCDYLFFFVVECNICDVVCVVFEDEKWCRVC